MTFFIIKYCKYEKYYKIYSTDEFKYLKLALEGQATEKRHKVEEKRQRIKEECQ